MRMPLLVTKRRVASGNGSFGSGLYDGEYADSGLFPLAVYGFHPCYGNSVSSELAEGADGISRQSVRC